MFHRGEGYVLGWGRDLQSFTNKGLLERTFLEDTAMIKQMRSYLVDLYVIYINLMRVAEEDENATKRGDNSMIKRYGNKLRAIRIFLKYLQEHDKRDNN